MPSYIPEGLDYKPEEEQQILDGYVTVVTSTLAFVNNCNLQHSAGSQAALEMSSFSNSKLLETAYAQGRGALVTALDHMVAFIKSLEKPRLSVAPWTSMRSALEALALSAWFLDPSIDPFARVTRSLAFRADGISEQMKLARAITEDAMFEHAIPCKSFCTLLGYDHHPLNNLFSSFTQSWTTICHIARQRMSD